MTQMHNRGRVILPLLISTVLAVVSARAEDEPAVEKRIDKLVSGLAPALVIEGETQPRKSLAARMEELSVPGVSLAVINDGRIEWARGFGLADVDAARAVDARTLFQAASISKPVAAMGALELVERGQLNLDADINTYVHSWHIPANPFTGEMPVTLRGLVSHTAGTTVHGFGGYGPADPVPDTVGVLDGSGNSDAITVDVMAGTKWRYSGGGYTIMQLAVEETTGQAFDRYQSMAVLWPLGMDDSTYQQPLPGRFHNRAASGYRRDGTVVEGRWHTYPELAAAGLWTTPTDLAKWLIALQQARHGAAHPVLGAEMVAAMLTPGMNGWGLGPVIEGDGDRFGHSGANEGFRCRATAFLDEGKGAVIMTNSDNGGTIAMEVILTIAEIYGWPNTEPQVRTVANLPAGTLSALEGTYVGAPGSLTFEMSGDRLLATTDILPGPPIEFRPESETRFFATDGTFQIEFTTNSGGNATVVIGGSGEFIRTTSRPE